VPVISENDIMSVNDANNAIEANRRQMRCRMNRTERSRTDAGTSCGICWIVAAIQAISLNEMNQRKHQSGAHDLLQKLHLHFEVELGHLALTDVFDWTMHVSLQRNRFIIQLNTAHVRDETQNGSVCL
jgi:hypothetical protein